MASTSSESIEIVAYDPEWPARFERERAALANAIGGFTAGGIHHVGSTAVDGLDAKPIIDILVGVESLDASRSAFEPLAQLGYMYAPYLADEMHWFCKPHPSRRTHHLHLAPVSGQRYRDELEFRDRLRASPDLVGRYAKLKRRLAARFEHDREGYTEAKTAFIAAALSTPTA
ncbi:MAG: GrpB family protein [Solirubrobacterales bacterium]